MSYVKAGDKVRVRIAPSPTGYLHVGNARTAILNWLFARKYSGSFLLRIEDTDAARSGEEMVKAIIEGLSWLGLNWDEEIIYQSRRLAVYENYLQQLIKEGKAYKCFCTKDVLDKQRQHAHSEKRDYHYKDTRRCYNLSPKEIAVLEKEDAPYAVRLLLKDGQTIFKDAVYGEIKVEHTQLDDFIIRRSDGSPTYHLAVVVDDHEMEITHIIRGEDHLSNTPKHIQLYAAFGWTPPKFAHVPLILGKDKQRLSKRHGATAVSEYKNAGLVAEAMFNFLSLLGWSSGDDRELFSREELISLFSIEGIQKKSAVFDEQKLEWMNGQYINAFSNSDFHEIMVSQLLDANIIDANYSAENITFLTTIAGLIKPRLKRLTDIRQMTSYFFADPSAYEQKAIKKHWKAPDQIERFKQLQQRLEGLAEFSIEKIEAVMRAYAEELGVGAGKIIQPVRLAITGIAATPGMFEVMNLLGQKTVLRRLQKAISYLQENPIQSTI